MSTVRMVNKSGHAAALLPTDYAPRTTRSEAQLQAMIEANPPVDCEFWDCFKSPNCLIERDGTLAIVSIPGAMMFNFDFWSACMGHVPIKQVCAALDEVAADPAIAHVHVDMNCAGSSCFGTTDLRAACDRLAKSGKKVSVIAHEQMTSGAYLAACRMTIGNGGKLYATPTASVGSIGVVIMLYDTSKMYEDIGIKVIPITTGELKSAGADGTQITEKQIEYYKGFVKPDMDAFAADVTAARGLTRTEIDALQAGLFCGPELVTLKLVDELIDAGALVASLRDTYGADAGSGGTTTTTVTTVTTTTTDTGEEPTGDLMADEPKNVKTPPATLAELKGVFGEDFKLIVASQEAGHTLAEALQAQNAALKAQMAERNTADANDKAEKERLAKAGVKPPTGQAAVPGGAVGAGAGNGAMHPHFAGVKGAPRFMRAGDDHPFMVAACEHAKKENKELGAVIPECTRMYPDLHQAYRQVLSEKPKK